MGTDTKWNTMTKTENKMLDLCGLWAGYTTSKEEATMLINVVEWKIGCRVGDPQEDVVFIKAQVVKAVEGMYVAREFRIIMPRKQYIFTVEMVYKAGEMFEISGDIYGPSPLSRLIPSVKGWAIPEPGVGLPLPPSVIPGEWVQTTDNTMKIDSSVISLDAIRQIEGATAVAKILGIAPVEVVESGLKVSEELLRSIQEDADFRDTEALKSYLREERKKIRAIKTQY